jgi:energy-coupling factor transporter ATP-binding protein EcfA2
MSVLSKKTKDLTTDERFSLYRAVGTSGLPYPASHFVAGSDGALEMEIGVIADDDHPLALYADMPHEHVVGLLYREMAIPSLLHVQKEAILRRVPESTNRLMAIVGDPGSGKSHMAKMMGRIRDPRGAEVIDCGGRYMGDLLFEQVIDFGEDFKTALGDRIKSGALSARSIKIFDEEFPDALTRDSDEKVNGVNWAKIGTPKNNGTEDEPKFETTADAVTRSMGLIENTIAKWESIPTQTVNTVGVRKQAGPLIRAFQEGRELVLDEYTKSIEGSDDSLQTVLQFMTGEIDEAVVENSMKVNGREETYAFKFRRADMKPGFFVTMTGNKDTDGHSTHTLSRSAYSRINPFTIEDPLPVDWKHRISQILTGVPLSTLYSVFSDMAQDDPEEFGDLMVELRLMGLDEEQRAKVPTHHITMLRNWQQTNEAVEKLSDFYMYWSRIVDPNSDLYDPDKQQNATNIDLIMPEISAGYRDESAVDFRKVIKDMDEALRAKPEVKKIDAGGSLRLNFGTVGKKLAERTSRPEVLASEFGTRLEDILLERIGTMTAGRPQLQASLMKEARERGILMLSGSNPEENPTISKLLNQDIFAHIGGIKNITVLREVLSKRMRQDDPALKGTDEDLIPLDQAAALCEEVSRLSANDDNNPNVGQIVMLGTAEAFNMAAAIDGIESKKHKPMKPDASQLVRTSDFLDTLRIPTLASINMRGIWRKTLSNDNRVPASQEYAPLVEIAEGTHESKVGITTIMTQNADGEAIPTHVMVDGERKRSLIVTDSVDDETKAALGKNYTVVSYDDDNAEEQVATFIADTLKHPARREHAAELEGQLIGAFMFRSGVISNVEKLAETMTRKDIKTEAPVYMVRQLGCGLNSTNI